MQLSLNFFILHLHTLITKFLNFRVSLNRLRVCLRFLRLHILRPSRKSASLYYLGVRLQGLALLVPALLGVIDVEVFDNFEFLCLFAYDLDLVLATWHGFLG